MNTKKEISLLYKWFLENGMKIFPDKTCSNSYSKTRTKYMKSWKILSNYNNTK
jgi:hypothetical protein